jgi:C-3',4' desaturase CrtD
MQVLSEQLSQAIETAGGEIRLRHRVQAMHHSARGWTVTTTGKGTGAQSQQWHASDVICSLPPQCLVDLLPADEIPHRYRQRLTTLPEPSGALVLYGVVQRKALPIDCPGHLQRGTEHPGSLFVSISRDGDGRAPLGQATVIASVFTPTADWCELEEPVYQSRKIEQLKTMKRELNAWLGLSEDDWIHTELATPRGFAGWTGRPRGMVGGLGQHPSRFGPFGLAGRTPLPGLWLCGDSLYPGEGTAGVTLSALNACRQLMEHRGLQLSFNR